MSRRWFVVLATVAVVVALAVRVHNALTFPPLRGYDGFGHFTYVWYVAATGHVPLPTEGWSFFHPPLYYALMAVLWRALAGVDPLLRLHMGSLLMAVLSLTHAAVLWVIVRRCFPGRRPIHLLAPALMLFLPVHIYSAPFIGNEGLAAVLCSLAILALLADAAHPSLARGVLLGGILGLAMLTKASALAVVGGAVATLAIKAWCAERRAPALRHLGVVVAALLVVSGWYYGRNVATYGSPFVLSRGEFMVRHVENWQTKGKRGLLEYVLFDPMILRRPQWPRSIPLFGEVPRGTVRGALRESVPTGLYATAWFEGFDSWLLPSVYTSELARRAGQALLCLGAVPTLLVLLGIAVAVGRLVRRGWDDVLGPLLLTFGCGVVVFVFHTHAAPMHLSVKATYLMPVTVIFGFWFALGLARLGELRPRWPRWVALDVAAVAVASVLVFAHGLLFPRSHPVAQHPFVWGNLHGIVYYAAGERARARELFRAAADANSHLGYENLAALALEDGEPLEALYLLRNAARLAPQQSFGRPADRRHYDRLLAAEYLNSMAVIYHRVGWDEQALDVARRAVAADDGFAEARYNLGVLTLLTACSTNGAGACAPPALAVRRADAQLAAATALDPGFRPAATMLGAVRALEGNCPAAAEALNHAPDVRRHFPVQTGRGIQHSAGIGRHRHIAALPEGLRPVRLLVDCGIP